MDTSNWKECCLYYFAYLRDQGVAEKELNFENFQLVVQREGPPIIENWLFSVPEPDFDEVADFAMNNPILDLDQAMKDVEDNTSEKKAPRRYKKLVNLLVQKGVITAQERRRLFIID